jgi:DNA-binding GntR family transcriptional regulator
MKNRLMVEITHESLTDRIYEILKDNIECQELPSGTRLIENDIAAQLNVSRTPVREAINRLSSEGLVVLVPRRGAFVASLTSKTIRELYEIREALEGLAIKLAAAHLTDEDLQALQDNLAQFRIAIRDDDFTIYFELDRKFHELLIELARNDKLLELFKMIDGSIHVTRWLHCETGFITEIALHEHQNIVAALLSRDFHLASQLVQAHIRRVKEELLERPSNSTGPNMS